MNNPDLLRQTMEYARNPTALQELMRNHDRALSNLEVNLEAHRSLRLNFLTCRRVSQVGSMHCSVSIKTCKSRCIRPLRNNLAIIPSRNYLLAIQVDEYFSDSTCFHSSFVVGDLENPAAPRTESTDPLPNPWGPRGDAAPGAAPSRPQQSSTSQQQQQAASAIPTGAAGSSPGLISPMMQNYMSQLVQNPRLLESVLNAPYMQPLMDSLAANPEISRQMVANNPMFANNPELREQMINALPAMMEQMRNPEVQALMQNREALEAITQVQEGKLTEIFSQRDNLRFFVGLQRLHTAAPNLFQA